MYIHTYIRTLKGVFKGVFAFVALFAATTTAYCCMGHTLLPRLSIFAAVFGMPIDVDVDVSGKVVLLRFALLFS